MLRRHCLDVRRPAKKAEKSCRSTVAVLSDRSGDCRVATIKKRLPRVCDVLLIDSRYNLLFERQVGPESLESQLDRSRFRERKRIPPMSESAKSKAFLGIAIALICGQFLVAQWSLRQENPTIDEVLHLPAGMSYWDTGSFRLYHHNPPLIKLLAAWPILDRIDDEQRNRLYSSRYWTDDLPNKAGFGHDFAEVHARDYFELFTAARSVMPVFLVIGGVCVLVWSRSVHGNVGGLLSLAVWAACPNLLAHGRLITSDAASAAIGTGATYLFLLYVRRPGSARACLAGLGLGICLLTKFSLLTLIFLWPAIWLVHLLMVVDKPARRPTAIRASSHVLMVTMVSMLVVNLGYGFEGTGRPIGKYEFYSQSLTRELPANRPRLHMTGNSLLDLLGSRRVNRFRDTWLGWIPCPLPSEFLLGFDEQKIDAEGVPTKYLPKNARETDDSEVSGYPVYLNGEIRSSGWWWYYPYAFLIKTPPGILFLIAASLIVLILARHGADERFEAVAMLVVPIATILAMTLWTNINIGLRYVLPALPYLYVGIGRLGPWLVGLNGNRTRIAAGTTIAACLLGAFGSAGSVAPHFLAYFNVFAGGPDHGSEHLIDSNLDWGQDLVNLKTWVDANAPDEPIGIAYFGQINPDIFRLRGSALNWFLPPSRPGTMQPMPPGKASGRLEAGLYAVSASLAHGLPWRVYDPARWAPYSAEKAAFDYFLKARPSAKIGWSIFIYKLDETQAERLEAERTGFRANSGQ